MPKLISPIAPHTPRHCERSGAIQSRTYLDRRGSGGASRWL